MLKYRIITALLLIPLVLLGIYMLPSIPFAIISGMVILLAGWEWARLMQLSKLTAMIYLVVLIFSLALFMLIPSVVILSLATCLWCALGYFVCYPMRFVKIWDAGLFGKGMLGILWLGSAWYGLNIVFNAPFGSTYVLFLLLCVWGSDVGAYFVGKYCGKHPLAPRVSPKKTVEGCVGGSVVCLLLAPLFALFFHPFSGHWGTIHLWILACLSALFSVVGDLAQSLIKRQVGVKDSGSLLPGHGGVFDRIDSLLAVSPVFALVLLCLLLKLL